MRARLRIIPALLLPILLLAPVRSPAQNGDPGDGETRETRPPQPGWTLSRTMRAFIRAVPFDDAQLFFPRHGDWEYHTSLRDSTGARHPGVWRFAAADVDSAIALPNGPLCNEFSHGGGVAIPSIVYAMEEQNTWRRTSATRYDAYLDVDEDRVWVRWRKEDGRWVIDARGSITGYIPPPPSIVAARRDTLVGRPLKLPLPGDTPVASGASWFNTDESIVVAGRHRNKYGAPRTLRERDLVTYTTFQGVPVYMEAGDYRRNRLPAVVYLPVDTVGTFQPYVGHVGNGCG